MSKFNIGDRVRIVAVMDRYVLNVGLKAGSEGVIKAFSGYSNTPLVEFDTLSEGHDGDLGDDARNRWWAYAEEMVLEKVKVKRAGKRKAGGRCDQVLGFLLAGKSLTQGEAIVLGFGTRLAATIHTLKSRGHTIITTMKEDNFGHPYAEYSLVKRSASGKRK